MTHVLDTSAILAHYFGEPGSVQVREIIEDGRFSVGISTLSLYEIETRLALVGLSTEDRRLVVESYVSILDSVLPVTSSVAALGAELRSEATARIAAADCLIAATALSVGAILVHRDAHFSVLSEGRPSQECLPEKH